MDTVTTSIYRQGESKSEPEILPTGKHESLAGTTNEEVPYLDYESSHGRPFVVDYLSLGDRWNDPGGSFEPEVQEISSYFKEKVENGSLANDSSVVRAEIKKMEKLNNLTNEPRAIIRAGILAAHIRFLKESDRLIKNVARYGPR